MKPLRSAALESADARGVTLALEGGWRCRVSGAGHLVLENIE